MAVVARSTLTLDIIGSLGWNSPFSQLVELTQAMGDTLQIQLPDSAAAVFVVLPSVTNISMLWFYTEDAGWSISIGDPALNQKRDLGPKALLGFANGILSGLDPTKIAQVVFNPGTGAVGNLYIAFAGT
jgi:hypothetical protein